MAPVRSLNTYIALFLFCFFSLLQLPVPCLAEPLASQETHNHPSFKHISLPSRENHSKLKKPVQLPLPAGKPNQTLHETSLSLSSKQLSQKRPQPAQTKNHGQSHMPRHAEITKQQVKTKKQRIAKIAKLLQHSRDLHRRLFYEREQNMKATAQFQTSLKRLSALSAARARAQKSLLLLERDIKEYRRQAPLYARTIDILHKQAGAAILEINRLRTSKYSVMHEKAQLQDHFRQRGLEAWVQNYLKDSVNPLVAGAVVEGTANVVEPMLDGIETLAAVNEDIARKMASQIGESVPIVEKPFYSGFVTYTVLLFPLVLVTSILLRIKRSLTKFSAGHFIILGNFYFTLLSGGCFIATLLGSVDVLLTFRHVNLGMFDLVMVLHGMLYIIHVSLHIYMALRVRENALVLHTLLLVLVGSHFFVHSYLHAMHNEDPLVDKRAYAVYTGLFAYVLYNWTVKHIRMSVEEAEMKLNNKSISTIENQDHAVVAVDPKATGLHRLSSQHSSASSMPYALPKNGSSQIQPASRGDIRIDNLLFSAPTISRERGLSTGSTYGTVSNIRPVVGMNADDPKDL